MEKLEIQKVCVSGEKIKEILFITVKGSDKMFIFFESGSVLELPVHRTCPSVTYNKDDFELKGRSALIDMLSDMRIKANDEIDSKIQLLKRL